MHVVLLWKIGLFKIQMHNCIPCASLLGVGGAVNCGDFVYSFANLQVVNIKISVGVVFPSKQLHLLFPPTDPSLKNPDCLDLDLLLVAILNKEHYRLFNQFFQLLFYPPLSPASCKLFFPCLLILQATTWVLG